MKRRDLIRHIENLGCEMLREGGNHTVYVNRAEKKVTTIPRHREIDENLSRKICKDLGVEKP
jgi:predicted RNA binding protein YcfA (HicA-like mRNA interferase family)